jgi:4-amino-4-deoxy-L-arabinose transferase-like glycosyltransferase
MIKNIILISIPFFLILLHILNLDSDPSFIASWGTMTDEGFWQHNARMKILFGEFYKDDFLMAYIGAPLYNLLAYLSHNLIGISYFAARIPSVISFWFVLLMMYLILKDKFGFYPSILSTLFLGMMHEILVYVKWGTPVILELSFLVAIFFFYNKWLKNKNVTFLYISGISYGLAITSKMTSVLFILPLMFFFILEYKSKRISLNEIKIFIYGFLFLMVPFFIFFVIENFESYISVLSTHAEWHTIQHKYDEFYFMIPYNLISAPFNLMTFKHPSAVIIFTLAIFYFCRKTLEVLLDSKQTRIFKIDSLENYCISWIIGLIIMLSINNQIVSRRLVQLFFPFFILAVYYILQAPKRNQLIRMKNSLIWGPLIIFSFIISYYFSSVYYISLMDLIKNSSIEGVFVKYSRARYLFVFIFFLTFSSVVKNSKFINLFFISTFLFINIFLNSLLYLNPTYSLKNLSLLIEKLSESITYTADKGFWYCINNKTHPIWFRNNLGINNDLVLNIENEKIFLFQESKISLGDKYIEQFGKKLDTNFITLVKEIKMGPIPFKNSFKETSFLYLYNPID